MIDKVVLKQEIQRYLLIAILIVLAINPLYALIILGTVFYVKTMKKKYKDRLSYLLIVLGFISLYFWRVQDSVLALPHNIGEYIFAITPARMTATILVSLISLFFKFGTTDSFLISEEKEKKESVYSKKTNVIQDTIRNTIVLGTTGSGKTRYLLKEEYYAIKNGEQLFIISGKNGVGEKHSLLNDTIEIANKFDRKVMVVSCNPKQKNKKPYNPFKYMTTIQCAETIVNSSEWSEEHYRSTLSCAIKIICELLKLANIPYSLQAITHFMDFENLRGLLAKLQKDKILSQSEISQYLSYKDLMTTASSSRARFLNLLLGEAKVIIGQGKEGISAQDAKNENAIFFIDLDSFSYTDYTEILGKFFIQDMRNIIANEEDKDVKKTIIMDELGSFANKDLLVVFAQARSYGYRTIIASQSAVDLDEVSETFSERILENCGRYVTLRLNSAEDAERMSKIIGTNLTVETTRKAKGMELHPTYDGSKKVVNNFRVSPDEIKELQPLEVIIYDKDCVDDIVKTTMEFDYDK